MGEKDREIDLPGGSFSRLLLSVEDVEEEHTFLSSFSSPPLFSINTPKMLCFGDFGSQTTRFNSAVSSSVNTHKNGDGAGGQESGQRAECKMGGLMVGQNQKNVKTKKKMKKNKLEVGPINASSCHAKAKREKLGERITSLQQLVSPYGKTDTASVLHEAMGYIRFLHDQVKVLSSPYLQRPDHLSEKGQTKARVSTKGLRSRGLCLVPVQYIVDVANTNGADFWSSSTTSLSTP